MNHPDWHSTKSDLAYAVIRDRILSNAYAAGAIIKQAALAKEIGISTTPLREALRRLKQEGLVDLDAHRDAHVTALSADEARDLLELRLLLDPMAAALAAERRTPDDVAEIRAASEIPALTSSPSILDLDAHRRFHRSIYTASHNSMLITTLDGLWDKADRYRVVALQEEREQPERDQTSHEHQELVLAVIAGDAEAAASIMRAHIGASLGAKAAKSAGPAKDAKTTKAARSVDPAVPPPEPALSSRQKESE